MIRPTAILLTFVSLRAVVWAEPAEVDFQRDIRPILSENCFQCHGPDPEHREADLRLDNAAGAHASAIVPGNLKESEFVARITSDDPEMVMPPAAAGKSLTLEQIELLKHWISQGAKYEGHWAFAPPTRPQVPQVANSSWVRNPIDAFVLNRLERENELAPSPEAEKAIWLRRLSLDLIGLPPSIEEVDAFVADTGADAYDRQIERMLASRHFGERWGREWLDAARYADSDGYEKDTPRASWFYRDWVINALNRDLPYDQFIVQQIAGDLLPNSDQDSLLATGFLRNSMINEEGGADPEQFRMAAMFDRMDAVGKAVLGLTVQCAQCHTHKYDPLSQHEYFGMFAFLNNTHDAIIPAFTSAEADKIHAIREEIDAIELALKSATPNWRQQMAQWETGAQASAGQWEVLEPVDLPFEGQKFRVLDDNSILSESYAPHSSSPQFIMKTTAAQEITGIRLELLTHPQLPRRGPGRSLRGTAALTEFTVYAAPANDPGKRTKLKLVSATADVNPAKAPQPDYIVNIKAKGGDKRVTGPISFALDGDKSTAWTTDSDPGRRNQSRKAVFVLDKPVGFAEGTVLTIQPTMNHGGWNNNDKHNCLMGRYRFSLTTQANPIADPLPQAVREILAIVADHRTPAQEQALFTYWRTTVEEWADENAQIEALWQSFPEGSSQLVLEERQEPRTTSLLHRGDFLSPTEVVKPSVPEFLHDLPAGDPRSRLTFAKWLVDRRSPTTARAIVNRIWQSYFGIGLVETSDDLGSQSTPPSHRDLLDWLAVELMDHDWSLKHLHRLIVSSAAYRQSSVVTEAEYQQDPYNRLLARGPRFRVQAEIVRDIGLTASGLLNDEIGGPPVYPPAPAFLFEPPASYGYKTWNVASDVDRYRRGLYAFRFRSVPFPMLETFDAEPGNVSCVRRNRSNTPLQALTLLNEPLAQECAAALALRTQKEGGETDAARLEYAMRCCIARVPTADEIAMLQTMLDKQRTRLAAGELDAHEIVKSSAAKSDDINEQAAWTLVARVILCLDETITKE
ncbi:PSD1 and planctomycete cytochrome C domain-containing protein [Blastopirellula marina]|uniref:PSD1 and planctomycete cytochrome C domain-containing protein n=1 Tax=Blastopirellula marina TaxID=124 RepID=UPI000321EED8|nr:PSD1 and planctomycete cytochrome C domain-containing protein [Blastopirellula marina]